MPITCGAPLLPGVKSGASGPRARPPACGRFAGPRQARPPARRRCVRAGPGWGAVAARAAGRTRSGAAGRGLCSSPLPGVKDFLRQRSGAPLKGGEQDVIMKNLRPARRAVAVAFWIALQAQACAEKPGSTNPGGGADGSADRGAAFPPRLAASTERRRVAVDRVAVDRVAVDRVAVDRVAVAGGTAQGWNRRSRPRPTPRRRLPRRRRPSPVGTPAARIGRATPWPPARPARSPPRVWDPGPARTTCPLRETRQAIFRHRTCRCSSASASTTTPAPRRCSGCCRSSRT